MSVGTLPYPTTNPRPRSVRKHALAHVAIIALGLLMIYPPLWMLSSSFKPGQLIFSEPGLWLEFWVKLRKDQIIPPADVQVQADAGGMATNVIVTNQTPIVLASSNGLTQMQRLTKTPLSMFSIPEIASASKDWWFFPPILLSVAANTRSPQLAVSLVEFFVNSVPAGKITRVDQGAPSSSAIRDALVPELDAPEAAFVKQISREMAFPARPLPVLPQASAAVVTAQMEASQQVAYGRQSVSEAVATFMTTARKAIGK